MHQHIRTVVGTAAVTAVLLLTGCSSDGAKDGAAKPSDSAASTGGGASAGSGDASTSPAGDAGAKDVTGSWTATANGKLVVLTIQGDMAGIVGEHLCTGRVVRQGGVALDLKCPNGNTDRAKGTVTAGGDGKSLTVKWEGSGTEEKFTKAAGGDLPSAVPTDFPSGMPSAPKLP
ncbi:hypothetical protein [Streptomyces sp. NPDC058657]|uniref:hypothetical protein n=1 Tax=unclassified Streptomyces TaxID=2593676 RepID=UPI0036623D78